MSADENGFFREATLPICGSLNIVKALRSCFDYVNSTWDDLSNVRKLYSGLFAGFCKSHISAIYPLFLYS